MKITNDPGLSQCWVTACERQRHDHQGFMSMTELLQPPRLNQLYKRHSDELTEDVSDTLWSLFGSACHYVLASCSSPDCMTEQRFNVKILDKEVSFCPDRVEPMSLDESRPFLGSRWPLGTKLWRLKDFKFTKVWAVSKHIERPKYEWVWQVNGYAWALEQIGFPVATADIEACMKDWSAMEFVRNPHRYPQYGAMSLPITLKPAAEVKEYLENRVRIHSEAEGKSDEDLPFCTLDERWGEPDLFVVKKKDKDNALPNCKFESQSEAEEKLNSRKDKKDCEVQFRKGFSKRCSEYCSCKNVCSQYLEQVAPAF